MNTPDWSRLTASERALAVELYRHGPLSRVELARRLGLSQTRLTRLTRTLLTDGLLRTSTSGRDQLQVGRPREPVDIVEGDHLFIGVKLTREGVFGVSTGIRADVTGTAFRPIEESTPAAVTALVGEVRDELRGDRVPTRVGIAISGQIAGNAIVERSDFLDWTNVPLAEMLEASSEGIAYVVENDIVALTQLEHWFGEGRRQDSFGIITIGAGIGYGLVIGGTIRSDQTVGVTSIGHTRVLMGGAVCDQGHRGCAVATLTTPSILGSAHAALGHEVDIEELLVLARTGVPAVTRIVDDTVQGLGSLIAIVASVAFVDDVMVTGEGVQLVQERWADVERAISDYRDAKAGPVSAAAVQTTFYDWARGAAVSAVRSYIMGG